MTLTPKRVRRMKRLAEEGLKSAVKFHRVQARKILDLADYYLEREDRANVAPK